MTEQQKKPKEHCGHEKVCESYLYEVVYGKFVSDQPCDPGMIYIETCPCKHDTRSHPPAQMTPDPTYQDLVDFARWTQTFWKNGIEIMRKNNLVIKTDAPMEKLAFSFYSDLCEIDLKAAHLFGEGYGDKNYRNESDVVSQTITAYPKPYEERIRADAIKQVREKLSHVSDEDCTGEMDSDDCLSYELGCTLCKFDRVVKSLQERQ